MRGRMRRGRIIFGPLHFSMQERAAGTSILVLLLASGAAAPCAQAAQLKKETAAAYERYLAASEKRIHGEMENGPFLLIDAWPEERRKAAYEQLRQGTVLVEQMNAVEEGHPIEVQHGLIHDWQGVLFLPHTTLAETLAVVQNYEHYQDYFRPEIRNSRLLSREGDDFRISLQLYKKSLITVAINANFSVHFERIGANRMMDRSYATRLAEVADVDERDAHELPPDDGNGFLWRLCDFWRFEERDGGVYMQLESIGLSRGVPSWIAWLVNPLLKSIPRGTLSAVLAATRTAVEKQGKGNGAVAENDAGPGIAEPFSVAGVRAGGEIRHPRF